MAKKSTFESLQNCGTAFTSKRGQEFNAELSAFLAGETKVSAAGGSYVVRNFVNLSNSVEKINDALGTDFVEDKEYGTVPANLILFTNTKEEAEALQAKMVKGARVVSSVTVGTHEYEDNVYIDIRVNSPYISEPKDNGGAPAASRAGKSASKSKDESPFGNSNPMDIADDDLPF